MNKTYTLIDIIKAAHKAVEKWRADRRINEAYIIPRVTQYIQDLTGYTLHFGGECPVDEDTLVSAVLNYDIGGKWTSDDQTAGFCYWRGRDGILAYRVIDPPKPKVDRSLRGHVMVVKDDNASPTEALADESGIYVESMHTTRYAGLWLWPDIESNGWEVYKL